MELADLEQEMPANKAVEESKQDRSEAQESHQEAEIDQNEESCGEGDGEGAGEGEGDNELSPEEQQLKDLRFLQGYWKLPAIAQFIKIFYPILGINQMSPQELEQ